jgi:hypothetical protein
MQTSGIYVLQIKAKQGRGDIEWPVSIKANQFPLIGQSVDLLFAVLATVHKAYDKEQKNSKP